MRQHELRAPHGARKARRRVGRGISSGQGKTSGKGTKGQLARSGPGLPGWFEGGQTPLHMRIPKLRGFKNRSRVEFAKVSVETLAAKGLLRAGSRIKILADGTLTKKLEVHAHAASGAAKTKIEAA